jgi:hypothetical protein
MTPDEHARRAGQWLDHASTLYSQRTHASRDVIPEVAAVALMAQAHATLAAIPGHAAAPHPMDESFEPHSHHHHDLPSVTAPEDWEQN